MANRSHRSFHERGTRLAADRHEHSIASFDAFGDLVAQTRKIDPSGLSERVTLMHVHFVQLLVHYVSYALPRLRVDAMARQGNRIFCMRVWSRSRARTNSGFVISRRRRAT